MSPRINNRIAPFARHRRIRPERAKRSADLAAWSAPWHSDGRVASPRLEIVYCTRCRWLLRASWFAQELLTTFETELGEVALIPGTGGVFEVRLDGELLWSRAERRRFPDPKEIKQAVRDRIAPGRSLGHSDVPVAETAGTGEPSKRS